MAINASKKTQYIKTGGIRCPFCDSEDIEGGSIQSDIGIAWAVVSCNTCLETWYDRYDLVNIDQGEED